MDALASAHLRLLRHVALAMLAAAAVALGGCRKKSGDASADAAALLDPDGGGEIVAIAIPDAGAGAGAAVPIVHALALITPVMNVPEWAPRDPSTASDERKGAMRLGYLRKGDTAAVQPLLVKKSNCVEGWYELVAPQGSPPGTTGGFVCGKDATLDPDDKELATAPHPPNMAGPLPYDYGLNLVDGAPLYRRPPLRRERKQYEQGLEVGRAYRKKDDDGAPAPAPAGPHDDGDTAWYLAHKGRSQISMDDLKGETSLIVQRMVKGFYLGLDKEVHAFAGTFWRTTRGMFVPKEHVLVHDPKVEFEGVWLGATNAAGETRHLPLGWITNPHQWKYTFGDAKMHRNEHVDRFTIVQLTGKKQVVDDKSYWETAEGWWMRAMDGTVTNPGPPPKNLSAGERWIDVNLGLESLVAFEGDKPVFATIISSGRHDDDPAKDHHTRPGEFRVREKHISATMDNDTATDGPYSIEDVPWIMYFDGSTALHGAFWHSRFGHERSHGCVNMTPHDAHELFGWVGPKLPDGWHGVRATDGNPGTRVIVHDNGKTAEESKKDEKDDAKTPSDSDAKDAPSR
jgi:hypothetical protein